MFPIDIYNFKMEMAPLKKNNSCLHEAFGMHMSYADCQNTLIPTLTLNLQSQQSAIELHIYVISQTALTQELLQGLGIGFCKY